MGARRILTYDTTLRDGEQREGVALTVKDKLKLTARLDEFGIDFIEGGFPASNPKDAEFFEQAAALKLEHSQLVAFGATCHKGSNAFLDENLRVLAACPAPWVALVGKASLFHVTQVLQASPEENLRMIRESISFLKGAGKMVFFDAEHFFDGLKEDRAYALSVLENDHAAGADGLILCETNGAALPSEIFQVCSEVSALYPQSILGIHTHDDCACAVANALEAVRAGLGMVQGTINGYGERVGNADLLTIIANLELKMGMECVGQQRLQQLSALSLFASELFNIAPDPHHPYSGASAFAHKGGLHASANQKVGGAYEHVDPAAVGNLSRVLVSELSGRASLIAKAAQLGVDLSQRPDLADSILAAIKERELKGYSYEVAEASLMLLLKQQCNEFKPHFLMESFRVIIDQRYGDEAAQSEATIKIHVGDKRFVATGEGNGPVNALDVALRKAITAYYPQIEEFELTDFKVRVLDESQGTDSVIRLLIESTDGHETWNTIGVSENIVAASWEALVDAVEYGLAKSEMKGERHG